MKAHIIDGKTYVEVERKAEVGEKIYVKSYEGVNASIGDIMTVTSANYDDGSVWADKKAFFDTEIGDKYRVLEQVADANTTEASTPLELTANDIRWQPERVIDLLANLARRVSSLERQLGSVEAQLKDTQGNVERQGVEIAEVTHLSESNSDDIRLLDDRTQVLNAIQKYYGGAR